MDTLTLKGLRYTAGHGYYNHEREKGNRFEVDIILKCDLKRAAESDDLAETVNYERIDELASQVMNGPPVALIETLTKNIGERLFSAFPRVKELVVRVRKMNPPLDTETEYSEVEMRWHR